MKMIINKITKVLVPFIFMSGSLVFGFYIGYKYEKPKPVIKTVKNVKRDQFNTGVWMNQDEEIMLRDVNNDTYQILSKEVGIMISEQYAARTAYKFVNKK